MAQDARRRDLLDDASSTPAAARLATDLRGDWCDARVSYDGEVVSDTGPAPDAVLVDLVAAALRTGGDAGAFDVFGESSDDDGGPLLLTYATARGAHGPSGTLSWRRARDTLLDGGEEVASCTCEVTPTVDGAQKRLVFAVRYHGPCRGAGGHGAQFGTGHALWPGAVALALWIVGRGSAARTVVELGCGACALPGARGRRPRRARHVDRRRAGAAARAPEARRRRGLFVQLRGRRRVRRPRRRVRGAVGGAGAGGPRARRGDRVPGRGRRGAGGVYTAPAGRRRHGRPVLGREAGALAPCGERAADTRLCGGDSVLTLTVTPDEGAATTHRAGRRARRGSSSSSVGASLVVGCFVARFMTPVTTQAQTSYVAGAP